MDAPVGSHCRACLKDARPPAGERLRRLNATSGPVVTKALVGLNLAVFLATSLSTMVPGSALDVPAVLGLFGPAVAAGDWYRLVTSGFVHFGLFHLGFNMLALYRFGGSLEPALGRTRFLALYLASLLAGSFGALLADPLA
ncbi:MAG: rhomboid family intramembrane serine protease, partial [Pseudonocardiaceae bacterium]